MLSPQMMDSGRALPSAIVKVNRLIWAALILGQLAFVVVILAIHPQTKLDNYMQNAMFGGDVVMLLSAIAATVSIPRMIIRSDADEQSLGRQCSIAMIIQMAMLEGASFIGFVLIFISGHWWPGVIVPAVGMAIQMTRFPRSNVKVK